MYDWQRQGYQWSVSILICTCLFTASHMKARLLKKFGSILFMNAISRMSQLSASHRRHLLQALIVNMNLTFYCCRNSFIVSSAEKLVRNRLYCWGQYDKCIKITTTFYSSCQLLNFYWYVLLCITFFANVTKKKIKPSWVGESRHQE